MNATYTHKYPIGSKLVFINDPDLDKRHVGAVVTVKSLHRRKVRDELRNFYELEEDKTYLWNEDLFELAGEPVNVDENEFIMLFKG